MFTSYTRKKIDFTLFVPALILLTLGLFILISLEYISPLYFVFVIFGIILYFLFASIDFEVLSVFSKYFYMGSIIFLLVPLIIGTATRGTIRWIPIGNLTIQPAELVRPFLLIFIASYLNAGKKNLHRLVSGILLFVLPTFLILIQPSLGVTLITLFGFLGVFLSSNYPKKYYFLAVSIFLLVIPVGWFLLADYQKERIVTFVSPASDPQGSGYNSIQSTISVGAGRIFGSGLGRGVQTQLAFLPERQSDFVFAAVSEELGLVGAALLLLTTFYLLWRLIKVVETSGDEVGRVYTAGLFLSLCVQIMIHVGMNLGLLPITGVPYPLISSGGSSLLATMVGLGIVSSVKNKESLAS